MWLNALELLLHRAVVPSRQQVQKARPFAQQRPGPMPSGVQLHHDDERRPDDTPQWHVIGDTACPDTFGAASDPAACLCISGAGGSGFTPNRNTRPAVSARFFCLPITPCPAGRLTFPLVFCRGRLARRRFLFPLF